MTKKFLLPDLGEGLPDATIVEWYVKVGDVIRLDENLVSMETAKAVVDVPSPVSGKVLKLAGNAGDIVVTGSMLAEFEVDASLPQRAEGQDTGHHHGPSHDAPEPPSPQPSPASGRGGESKDAGTVVGAMQVGDAVVAQAAIAVGGVKAMPAVRAMARKLGIDIARVSPSGADGTVTMDDVKRAAADGSLLLPSPSGRGAGGEGQPAAHHPHPNPLPPAGEGARSAPPRCHAPASASAAGMATAMRLRVDGDSRSPRRHGRRNATRG